MVGRLRRVLAVAVTLAGAGDHLAPDASAGLVSVASIVVNDTADINARDTVVTLREALLLATGNLAKASLTAGELAQVTGNPGPGTVDTISFAPAVFPPASATEIHLDTSLPPLSTGTDVVTGVGAGVRLTCASDAVSAILVVSPGNVVRGLEITGCERAIDVRDAADDNVIGGTLPGQGNVLTDNGIGVLIGNFALNPDGNRVVGNHVGVRPNDVVADGNGNGIMVLRASGNVVEGNVISGNSNFGLGLIGNDSVVRGNRIGTDTAGLVAVPNGVGLLISPSESAPAASFNLVGGLDDTDRNLISGNFTGIELQGEIGNPAENNRIIGNRIGTTLDGTAPLPNGVGVRFEGLVRATRIGGTEAGAGNLIAFNDAAGISLIGDEPDRNFIILNSIHSNGALAIDLGGDGVTPNDDTDGVVAGPNGFQNFPVITAVSYAPAEPPAAGGMLVVEGTLETAPLEGDLRVDVFANAACDPSGHGEAELPLPALATTGLTTEADGSVGFVASAEMPVPALRVLTATATSDVRGTSEMSACAMLVAGEPCDADAECSDGDDCNGVERCIDDACQGGTPPACDDGRVCNGTATCANDVCQPGTPLDCDDAETCTDDTCDDASGCANTPLAGVASVACRLDTMAAILAAVDLPEKLRRKLETRLERARGKLEASPDLDGPRQARALKKAGRLLTGLGKFAARQRGKKLPEDSADALAAAVDDSLTRLASLAEAFATAAWNPAHAVGAATSS